MKCTTCGFNREIQDITFLVFEDEKVYPVCSKCLLDNRVAACKKCGRYFCTLSTRIFRCKVNTHDSYLCSKCYQEGYVICSECGEVVHISNTKINNDGTLVCKKCK